MRSKDAEPSIDAGIYRHYKGGLYETDGKCALDTEYEDRWLVLYKKVGETLVNARPYEMFIESVTVDGQTVPRFEKISGEPHS